MNLGHGGNLFEICRERGWDWREVLDLSASINPLGPAPGVWDAIRGALDRVVHYPEKYAPMLAAALAERWGVGVEQVLVGNGATELIHFVARAWPHEDVSLIAPAFSEYHRAWPRASLCRFGRASGSGLVVLAQPNNPAGEAVAFEILRDWLLGSERPALIDESFIEFANMPSAVTLAARRPNLLVLRSMTKFYALPGLRIGAMVGHPDLISRLRELREPWQVNALAEAAALAALADTVHAERSIQLISRERIWFWKRLWNLPGVKPVHSSANFFLVHLDCLASDLCRFFLDRKAILRDCTGWPGVEGQAVRFAIRTRQENERTLALFKEFLCTN